MKDKPGKPEETVTDETAKPDADQTAPEAKKTEPNEPGKADAPLTMTPDELNAKIETRVAEVKASEARKVSEKYGDLDALKTKATELDTLKEADLSELQKAQRDLTAAQGEVKTFAPKMERLEKYETYMKTHIDARTENLPDVMKALIGKLTDPLEVLALLDEYADDLGKTDVQKPKPAPAHAGDGLKAPDGTQKITLTRRANL